jgi:Zn-dependent protease with chaperone function
VSFAERPGPGWSPQQHIDYEVAEPDELPGDRSRGLWNSRPPGYGNATIWLASGLFRDRRSLLIALGAAWLNLPLAVLGGGVGLVLGAVAGAGTGIAASLSDRGLIPNFDGLFTSALFQVGGIVGGVVGGGLGLVAGFLAGLFGPWLVLFTRPAIGMALVVGQLIGALLVGMLYVAVSVAAEGWLLRLQGARRMSRRESRLLTPIVEKCAAELGISSPRVMIDDSNQVKAGAGARHIVLTQGMLDEFRYDPRVLGGVISHELVHWRNADAVARALVRGILLPIYVPYLAIAAVRDRVRNQLLQFLVLMVGWPIDITVRRIVMPIQALDARTAEYMADQGAVLTGHRNGLRHVLGWLHGSLDGARNGWEQTLCATHPPNELRLERLEEPGRDYVLPDEDAPARVPRVEVVRTWRETR